MSDNARTFQLDPDMKEVLVKLGKYFDALIDRQNMPIILACCLNGEIQSKLQDAKASLVAMMEDILSERGQKSVAGVEARLRISYFDSKIESKLASELHLPEWRAWCPVHTERAMIAGTLLTGAFGLAAVLAALKAADFAAIKAPVGGTSATIVLAALASLSAVASAHPEKIPLLMEKERTNAKEHLGRYLQHAEVTLTHFVRKTETSFDVFLEQLKMDSRPIT